MVSRRFVHGGSLRRRSHVGSFTGFLTRFTSAGRRRAFLREPLRERTARERNPREHRDGTLVTEPPGTPCEGTPCEGTRVKRTPGAPSHYRNVAVRLMVFTPASARDTTHPVLAPSANSLEGRLIDAGDLALDNEIDLGDCGAGFRGAQMDVGLGANARRIVSGAAERRGQRHRKTARVGRRRSAPPGWCPDRSRTGRRT